jgi:hypothetical protein
MKWLRSMFAVSAILVWLILEPIQVPESYALDDDVIGEVEDVLTLAAQDGFQRHGRQDSIQRDVHDLTFLLELSLRAAEESRHSEKRDYAQQALALLQRGARLGHFDLGKAEPVLTLIRHLSDQAG